MSWKMNRDIWLRQLPEDDPLLVELAQMRNEKGLEECFYKNLEFGTGGMRGIMGPGTNRLNIYTVRKVATGLARYMLNDQKEAAHHVVVAYDSRHLSKEFALEMAKTLGHYGIKVFLFEELCPTPLLSYAVRYLQTTMGIMITASHNPPQYNGLKVYGEDGAQISLSAADKIINHIQSAGQNLVIEVADEKNLLKNGTLVYLGEEVLDAYIENLQKIRCVKEPATRDLPIVFTSLHGTANTPIRKAFDSFGFTNIQHVAEQELPDPNFTTVQSPNPEEAAAFDIAIQYGKQYQADLLLAADPDADRLGVAIRNESGEYVLLTGNQIGVLMCHYMLEQKKQSGMLPENGALIKTIVSTELVKEIGERFDVATLDVLTGFKFIAEKILEFEQTNDYTFLFGYEESHGYLIKDFVRDKDAVQAALYVAEMAAVYKLRGKTMAQVLQGIYEEFGFYRETTTSLTMEGKEGAQQIDAILEFFRQSPPEKFHLAAVVSIEDYQTSEALNVKTGRRKKINLPVSNVLKYILDDGSWIVIRPSGTEPKCKFYMGVKADEEKAAAEKLRLLEKSVSALVEGVVRGSVSVPAGT